MPDRTHLPTPAGATIDIGLACIEETTVLRPPFTGDTKGEELLSLSLLAQILFLGVVTANFTSKLKQIQEDTAEVKEQVTNSHSANFRDEVTQIVPDVKAISATLSKISEIQESRDRQAVDTRLQALDRRAQSEHASIWDALRKHHT